MEKGKYIQTAKKVTVYDSLAGKPKRVSNPNGWVGKVTGSNTSGTWIEINFGEWVLNDSSYQYLDRMTDEMKLDYAAQTKNTELATTLKEGVKERTEGVTGVLSKASEGLSEGLTSSVTYLKWVLVVILIVVVISLYIRITGK